MNTCASFLISPKGVLPSVEGMLRSAGNHKEADALRTRYIAPLLEAKEDSLSEEQAAKRKDIIETEREEARAARTAAK